MIGHDPHGPKPTTCHDIEHAMRRGAMDYAKKLCDDYAAWLMGRLQYVQDLRVRADRSQQPPPPQKGD